MQLCFADCMRRAAWGVLFLAALLVVLFCW